MDLADSILSGHTAGGLFPFVFGLYRIYIYIYFIRFIICLRNYWSLRLLIFLKVTQFKISVTGCFSTCVADFWVLFLVVTK